jgi:hypothetical protein
MCNHRLSDKHDLKAIEEMKTRNYRIEPTGKPLDLDDKTPATVCISTDVMKYRVVDKIRERERKLFILLVHTVWHELGKTNTHKIEIDKIKGVFRKVCSTKSYKDWLWEYLENLSEIKVVYRDEKLRGVTHLFASAYLDEEKEYIYFQIPEILTQAILSANCFARLDTYFLIGLRGKYAVSLYQFLESKVGMDKFNPSLAPNKAERFVQISLDDLKEVLSIKDNEYDRWSHFKQRVLDPAVDEINTNSMQSTFRVEYETVTAKKRKVAGVKIFLTKTPERLEKESQLRKIRQLKISPPKPSPEPSQLLSDTDEVAELVVHFERARNSVAISPDDVSHQDLGKAAAFMLGITCLEDAKEIISIICHYKNRPDFFGGLVKHKARAIAEFETRKAKQKQVDEGSREKKRIEQEKKKEYKKALETEFTIYFDGLEPSEVEKINQEILSELPRIFIPYFDSQRDDLGSKVIIRDRHFRWWLVNKMGVEEKKVDLLLKTRSYALRFNDVII